VIDLKLNRLFHSKLQVIIFFSALALSTSIIGLFLCRIPNSLPLKIGAGFFTVFLEVSMAYVLSLALSYWRRNKAGANDRTKAVFLLIFYSSYVFIACLSAIMLFMLELNTKDVIAKEKTDIQTINQTGYDQAAKDAKMYSELMEAEKATGAKAKFEKWRELKEAAEKRRDKYEKALTTKAPEQNIKTMGSGFTQIFPKIWKALLITIFGIIMAVIYVMQVLTAWEIPLPGETENKGETSNNVTPNVTPPVTNEPDKPRKLKPVTVKALHSETAVTGEHVTCECGCGLPAALELGAREEGFPPDGADLRGRLLAADIRGAGPRRSAPRRGSAPVRIFRG
jgi:hypothetical protein